MLLIHVSPGQISPHRRIRSYYFRVFLIIQSDPAKPPHPPPILGCAELSSDHPELSQQLPVGL